MAATAGARRVVSVLVADVAASTTIAERLGPERSKFLFDDVVRLMREEVERFGGTLAQLTGDGVLALFGAPVAHEDDAERGVRAALAIREAVAAYGGEVGVELAARVAVNTGPVVVPDANAPAHELYNALGDTVNVAARLQAVGDLVLGPTTAQQVVGLFELDELGELDLKGKTQRIAAYRVVGTPDRAPRRPEPRLVGRGGELHLLSEVISGLLDGRGAIISITGEPGIGKSRLVAEVEQRVAGVRFLTGHAVAYAASIPYWPVRELLRGWLGLGVSDPEARVRLELRAELSHLLGEDGDDAYPFVAGLLGLGHEQYDLAGDAVQHETFYWIDRLVRAVAGERALCFVLEDLHWSDEATLALLEQLLPVVEQAPVGFVLVHRSDPDHAAWQLIDRARRRFRRCFDELELEPRADADVRDLAETDAGGDLPDALALALAERTGGNPYFVGEAIRDLRERGALRHENGRLVLAGEAVIPTGLQAALQARLDRLDRDARVLITTAAVIGRSFGLALLERLLPRMRLLPTLSELEWLQLLVEERSGRAPEYRFRHGLVREAAYETLTGSARRDLHLQVAEALIDLYRDSPAEIYGLLGHHFAEADEPERAVEYLLKAGDAARTVFAQDEAISLYRRALGFMERTGDSARARQILLRIGLTHHLAFDFAAANAAFSGAFSGPASPPARLEPTERLRWPLEAAGTVTLLAALSASAPNYALGPNLFRGLLAIGRDVDVVPDMAERFTVSDNGRLYRFTLRSDARWSDGLPVTADDFAFTFGRLADGGLELVARLLDGVDTLVVDERTLELRLHEPRSDFLYRLAVPPLAAWPRHVCERDGPDWHHAAPLVGSGPFIVKSRDADHLLLEASTTWCGARGNVREVFVGLEATYSGVAEAWRTGMYDLHTMHRLGLPTDDGTILESWPAAWTWYMAFNANRAPFDDARVRRAIAHAIDRTGPAAALGGSATAAGGLVPPALPGHSERVAPRFDPERARALLNETGELDEIELACLELWDEAAFEIADQLSRIGIAVRVLVLPSDPALEAAVTNGAHAFLWAWGADLPDPGGGFLEAIIADLPLCRDAELNRLLDQAAASRDQDERLGLYRAYEQRWIGEQAALVPLAYSDRTLTRRAWVSGMWINPIAMATFAEAIVDRQ
ncbi:MAG TPA: ABC transporter substrate-binding protein [Gaiellaceae bacterium]|nr:ABC transporter substrate-binding protein [Gaiellaceae bacterium]